MAKKSLRAQLNQIRAWVRQGRTDAWIAHQLEVPASELREFRRRHELTADGDEDAEVDLRDEIEAEIEAATLEEDEDEDEDEEVDAEEDGAEDAEEREPSGDGDSDADADSAPAAPKRRRRRGRRGRGAKKLEASFDHGGDDGYGLWLDAAVADDPVYSEHWAGHRAVEVQIEPDQITIRRSAD
ncbi:MAG: hypothetical protein ACR2OC_06710 [Solirubrobacterales bacterium]